jgi:hypothetical protein
MTTELAGQGPVDRGVRPLVEKRADGYWLTMPCNSKAWCEVTGYTRGWGDCLAGLKKLVGLEG